jgi:hypothetical protein
LVEKWHTEYGSMNGLLADQSRRHADELEAALSLSDEETKI